MVSSQRSQAPSWILEKLKEKEKGKEREMRRGRGRDRRGRRGGIKGGKEERGKGKGKGRDEDGLEEGPRGEFAHVAEGIDAADTVFGEINSTHTSLAFTFHAVWRSLTNCHDEM